MLRKLTKDMAHGVGEVFRTPVTAVSITVGWWLDRADQWRDRREDKEPRRSVSQNRLVRYALGVHHLVGAVGWLLYAAILASGLWLVWGQSRTTMVMVMILALSSALLGARWVRRNRITEVVMRCECDEFEED